MKKGNQIGEIIIYEGDDGQPRVEVRIENESANLVENDGKKSYFIDKDGRVI